MSTAADSRTKPDRWGRPTVCIVCGDRLPKSRVMRTNGSRFVNRRRRYCDWHANPTHRAKPRPTVTVTPKPRTVIACRYCGSTRYIGPGCDPDEFVVVA